METDVNKVIDKALEELANGLKKIGSEKVTVEDVRYLLVNIASMIGDDIYKRELKGEEINGYDVIVSYMNSVLYSLYKSVEARMKAGEQNEN